MLEAARIDMKFVLSLPRTEASAITLISRMYENFRTVGNALLRAEGIEAKDHDPQIQRAIRMNIATPRPLRLLENLKRMRKNINYHGFMPGQAELDDFADFADKCWNLVLKDAERTIKNPPPLHP